MHVTCRHESGAGIPRQRHCVHEARNSSHSALPFSLSLSSVSTMLALFSWTPAARAREERQRRAIDDSGRLSGWKFDCFWIGLFLFLLPCFSLCVLTAVPLSSFSFPILPICLSRGPADTFLTTLQRLASSLRRPPASPDAPRPFLEIYAFHRSWPAPFLESIHAVTPISPLPHGICGQGL